MKKLKTLALLLSFSFLLSACATLEEDYFIYSDGSVIFQQKNDLSQIMSLMEEDGELSEDELSEMTTEMDEDMCDLNKFDDPFYYNCFNKDNIYYQQALLKPDLNKVIIEDGIYELDLVEFSDIFELAGASDDEMPEGFDFGLEARFNFEGEVLYSDVGEISENTVTVTLAQLQALEEFEEIKVRAKIDNNTEYLTELLYRSKLNTDASIDIYWPIFPKQYRIKAQEMWQVNSSELDEQISSTIFLGDGVEDDDLNIYFKKIDNNYYAIGPSGEQIDLVENTQGDYEITIIDVLNDIDPIFLKPKYEIEFFSDIVSADLGTINGNLLSFNKEEAIQLKEHHKVIISKDEGIVSQNNENIFNKVKDQAMHQKLKGKILLQVEASGEAYYVHPEKLEMFFLGRPEDAFSVMREQGIGISNENLLKIPAADTSALKNTFEGLDSDGDGYDDYTELINGYNPNNADKLVYDLNFTSSNSGKIFLQVEQNGEAWYINGEDNKRYFLGRPADAFEVMRNLGLGISDENLNKLIVIDVKSQEKEKNNDDFVCGSDLEFIYNNQVVTNKTINKNNLCWLDRNLGANRACESFNDSACYGDYFQWGRSDDGHQLKNSLTSLEFSDNIKVGHSKFILDPWPHTNNGDWLVEPNNNLWQGADGLNNPCPEGWRLPTETELKTEQDSWQSYDYLGAFNSALKWPSSGYRSTLDGQMEGLAERGMVWGSTTVNIGDDLVQDYRSINLYWLPISSIRNINSFLSSERRGYGFSLRCVLDINN